MTRIALLMCGVLAVMACDDKSREASPAASASAKVEAEPPAPAQAPDLVVDNLSPKVGFTRVLLDKPQGKKKLSQEIDETRKHWEGQVVPLAVDRKAKVPWVVAMIDALDTAGAKGVKIKTPSRDEFPKELHFVPQGKLEAPPPCTVVAMILADRGTAVWKLAGGTASKRVKGFAGPDLSMTSKTLKRYLSGCKGSNKLLVSAADGIEWGLTYDLAAVASTIEKVEVGERVLLREPPIAGRPVKLE